MIANEFSASVLNSHIVASVGPHEKSASPEAVTLGFGFKYHSLYAIRASNYNLLFKLPFSIYTCSMTSSDVVLQAITRNLDCKLSRTPLPPATRCAILNKIWFLNQTVTEYRSSEDEHSAYFQYYEVECSGLTRGGLLQDQNQDYLLKIIGYIQNSSTEYHSVVDALLLEYPSLDDSIICASISVAARVWSMLHIGAIEQAVIPGQRPIDWKNGSFKQRVQDCFERDSTMTDIVKLSKAFNAMNLDQMGGIEIVWTSNLADHLLVRDDDTKVNLFHHASFLRRHKNGKL